MARKTKAEELAKRISDTVVDSWNRGSQPTYGITIDALFVADRGEKRGLEGTASQIRKDIKRVIEEYLSLSCEAITVTVSYIEGKEGKADGS